MSLRGDVMVSDTSSRPLGSLQCQKRYNARSVGDSATPLKVVSHISDAKNVVTIMRYNPDNQTSKSAVFVREPTKQAIPTAMLGAMNVPY